MIKKATISPCGTYRYSLARIWDPGCYALPFLMLNPSTADAEVDDPTIRRCIGFAQRENYGGIVVANLFALRSPSPKDLERAYYAKQDPVGPENDQNIRDLFEGATGYGVPIICAWGANAFAAQTGRVDAVKALAVAAGAELKCLDVTQAGAPKHPLYIAADQPLLAFA